MREFLSITWALFLAIAVHLLMAVVVVLGTMDWKPFKPPVLTGMTIEAVMVDTAAIKEARLEAERAAARKAEQERRAQELQARREREAEEERQRQREALRQQREEDLRLQQLRKKQEQDRKDRMKKQQDELERLRQQREEAARQARLEEERLKQLDARRQAEREAQDRALAESDLQRQLAQEQAEFRAGEIATLGDQYYAAIQAQVTNNWLRPPTARPGLRCRLKIVQIPGGEVISAAIAGQCIADEATRRSIIAAVERAGLLPYRGFEEVFEREIDFIFTYDE
ncbi:MAG: cell envelope integrity protein TolA [Xanthomonadales bacterium]|nr:cell envelope integrity protein TolA [Xanthomonadales bacterium]